MHVVIWLAFGRDRISRKAKTAIDAARKDADGLAISDITLFELATLTSKGWVRLDISLESLFCKKLNPGLWSCRLQVACVHVLDFHRLIRKIQPIALSELPH